MIDKRKTQNAPREAGRVQRKTSWRWVIGLGVGILLLAFLRIYNLTQLPIFADEAIYVRWAQVMRAEPTLRFLPLSDGKQPLFMWTVMPALKFFSDPLFAGRIVSVLSGLATLVGIFLLSFFLFKSKRAAIFSSFLYAISPYSVFFDRMALVDSMLTTFGVWTLLFGTLTAKTLRLDMAILTGFALGGAVLTKSPGFFFVALIPTTVLLVNWAREREEKIIQGIKLLGLWAVSWVIAFFMYNIQRLGPNFHLIAQRNKDYVYPLNEILLHPLTPFLENARLVGEYLFLLLPATFLLIVIFVIWKSWRKFWRQILVLGFWFAVPLAISIPLARDLPARYIFYTIPPLFILSGIVAELFRAFAKNKLVWGALALIVAPALWLDFLILTNSAAAPLPQKEKSGYFQEWTSGIGVRGVADYIKQQKTNNKEQTIVIGTEGFFGTLPNGLEIYLQNEPDVTIIGVGVIITDLHPSLVEAKKAGNRVFLVVNDTRFEGDAQEQGLKLVASYPKQVRPDGSQEKLLLFEVTDGAITPKSPQTWQKT